MKYESYGLMHLPSKSIQLGSAKYPRPMSKEDAMELLKEKEEEVGVGVYQLIPIGDLNI